MANGKIISLESKRLEKSYQAALKAAQASRVPTQSEYERNERASAMKHERQIDEAPLADRKDAQKSFLEAMRERPQLVGERLGWLFEGNYGYGPMIIAKEVLARPRMNREAILTQMIAVFEWMCPRRMAVDAWKKLTPAEKDKLSKAIAKEIKYAEKAE